MASRSLTLHQHIRVSLYTTITIFLSLHTNVTLFGRIDEKKVLIFLQDFLIASVFFLINEAEIKLKNMIKNCFSII